MVSDEGADFTERVGMEEDPGYFFEIDSITDEYASARVYRRFDQGKKFLEARGFRIQDGAVTAKLRMTLPRDKHIVRHGHWIRAGVIYRPGEDDLLIPESNIVSSDLAAHAAARCQKEQKEYHLDKSVLEKCLQGAINIPDDEIQIPTERLGDEALTVLAIGGGNAAIARDYGAYLKEHGGLKYIKFVRLSKGWVDSQESPFERLLLFHGIGDKESYPSGLNGTRDLILDPEVRGYKLNDAAN